MRSPSGDHAGCSSAAPEADVRLVTVDVEASSVNTSGSPSRSDRKTMIPFVEGQTED